VARREPNQRGRRARQQTQSGESQSETQRASGRADTSARLVSARHTVSARGVMVRETGEFRGDVARTLLVGVRLEDCSTRNVTSKERSRKGPPAAAAAAVIGVGRWLSPGPCVLSLEPCALSRLSLTAFGCCCGLVDTGRQNRPLPIGFFIHGGSTSSVDSQRDGIRLSTSLHIGSVRLLGSSSKIGVGQLVGDLTKTRNGQWGCFQGGHARRTHFN
jgi:hypothetical protein